MKSQASIIIAIIAIILVSCAPISTPEPIESTSTNIPEPTATFTPEPTATFTPESTATFTPEPTATFTPEPTATLTPQLFDLRVSAFWDYNGNGKLDEGELPLEGIVSQIAGLECITELNGMCEVALPEGKYTARFITTDAKDATGTAVSDLSYMFFGTDILKPTRGIPVAITEDTMIDVALAQGPYPVPANNVGFADGIYKPFGVVWAGDTEPHGAIDLAVLGENNPNTPPVIVYASVTGQIEKLPDSTPEQLFGPCGLVIITPDSNQNVPGAQFYTGHLTSVYVTPNEKVVRGQPIGEIDPKLYVGGRRVACTYPPHLEFTLWGGKWINPLLYSPINEQVVFGSYGQ